MSIKKFEEFSEEKVICSKCGWSWKVSEGGDDLLTCHKCGFINDVNSIKPYSDK
jgi:ribosomal protein L37AE/L43A